MKHITLYLRKLLEILSPSPQIYGLEIGDNALKFLTIGGKKQQSLSLRLPAGTIESGEIKNKPAFLTGLLQLRGQINGRAKDKVHVIVTLSDVSIYTQVFKLPPLPAESLEEAVRLNLRSLSPFDPEHEYSSSQVVGETSSGEQEILGAFINKDIVSNLIKTLGEAGLETIALEFQSLSIGRLVRNGITNLPTNTSHIILRLLGSGLNFIIIKNGQVYFDYFLKWSSVVGEERQLKEEVFKNTIIEEARRVINFHDSRFGARIDKLTIMNEIKNGAVEKMLQEKLNLPTQALQLPKFPGVGPEWWPVLGASLRGRIPRSEDRELDLSGIQMIDAFYREKMLVIMRLWRKIIWGSMLIVLAVFYAGLVIVQKENDKIAQEANNTLKYDAGKAASLREEAARFNSLVSEIGQIEKSLVYWSRVLASLESLSGTGTHLEHIEILGAGEPINLVGTSVSSEEVINFKKLIEKDPGFSEVSLPIQNIVDQGGGKWGFRMTVKSTGQ